MTNAFATLQKVGKALMLPVSVLPVAGIMLGVGAAQFSFLPAIVSSLLQQAGGAVFENMALLFAMGVALGFTRNDGVAAVAALIGYEIMGKTITLLAPGTDTGVLGGIIAGGIAAWAFNRFFKLELPVYLGFFSGKRAVPIITGFAAILAGALLTVVWWPIGAAIDTFSHWAAYQNPTLAFGIYGVVERALIPFGLHHVWNAPFFFEVGSYTLPSGEVVRGVLSRFMQGDGSAGQLAGGYFFKMFGLPAAAVAIWHSARPENRAKVGSLMVSAALTSFLTGITEPIEFAFLFVAPVLYGIHALLAGSAYVVSNALGIVHGTSFSHGLIDFVVLSPNAQKIPLMLVVGLGYAVVYYVVFRVAIKALDLKTPGREIEAQEAMISATGTERASQFIEAFGGPDNLSNVDSCITRLRMTVVDPGKVDQARLKQLGASGVLVSGNAIQAIVGTIAENTKTEMEELLRSGGFTPSAAATPASEEARDQGVAMDPEMQAQADALKAQLPGLKSAASVADNRLRINVADTAALDAEALSALGVVHLLVLNANTAHLLFADNTEALGSALGQAVRS
ncbi:PTS glucose transporter subunit IIBC [Ferrimonas gelatinilytica]|uniref:PTS system glucose-specific EIICB component n=1 Tax=Ferrimonas gelatinilytica TaxID=1255257 RepID=A0ABP9RSL5_9GAMM